MKKTPTHPAPVLGAFLMALSGLSFVGVYVTVKYVGTRLPAAEAAWIRYILGLVFLIPVIPALRREGFDLDVMKLGALRALVHVVGVALWFFAMARITVAEVTAMGYLTPVFVTLGAVVFLGERFALRRALAIGCALLGVLIILRPGFREIQPAHLFMILTTMGFGASYLVAKKMTGRASTNMIVAQLSVWVSIGLTPLAMWDWVTPNTREIGLLFATAFFATAGHYFMTMAFQRAPLGVLQPVTFLQLVWSVMVGLLLFNEAIDQFVIIGGAIIVSSVVYITLREARLRDQSKGTKS